MSKKIKIAFLCSVPPTDKKVWSGTIYSMYQTFLDNGFEVEWIPVNKFLPWQNSLFSAIEKFYKKIFNRGFNSHHFIAKSIIASRILDKNIQKSDADVIFAPTTIAELAFLKSKKPVLYLNDATFHQLINYYGAMSGFGLASKKITEFIEKKALQRADALVYSSDWASNHAINHYKIPSEKVHTVKFGSNASAPDFINAQKDYSGKITFLFLAVDWDRKGGEIALKTIEILKNKGYDVMLKVVGCTPPIGSQAMEVIPFLNKNNPQETQKIIDFLNEAHYMFIPTRADCTPISFCEAASYGLPIISTKTGGVDATVEHGKTGILLPESAGPEHYAIEIQKLLETPELAKTYAMNARKKYETELNWEVFGEKIKQIIDKTLHQQ